MDWDVKKIIAKYERLYREDSNWRSLWQDVADYICVKRSNILATASPGSKQTEKLYDSTATHANELLAASMKQAITPANIKWFSLKIRNEELQDDEEVQRWLEFASKKMFIALYQSNFDSEVHELYLDLGSFGMGAMFEDEKDKVFPGFNGLRFHTLAIGEYVIEEDFEGNVNGLIRKFYPTATQAFHRWKNKAGPKIIKAMEGKGREDRFPFLHSVLPLEKNPKRFASCYINLDTKEVLEKRVYYEFPFLVPRWSKTSGEKNGRGPGLTAMPNIKTLNKAVQLELKALAKMINPPWKASDRGVVGVPQLVPGGGTYIRPNAIFEPLKLDIDLATSQVKADQLRQAIRRMFYSDQLQLQDTPTMTAAEAYIRYELMQRILGPTLGRMERELLNPLIERTFGLMYRAGAFGEVPTKILELGADLDVEYEGEMSKAQRSRELTGFMDVLQVMAGVAEIDQSIFDWINIDTLVKWLWQIRGIPTELLNDKRTVEDIRERRGATMSDQEMQQRKALVAEIIKKITPALEKGLMPEALQMAAGGEEA